MQACRTHEAQVKHRTRTRLRISWPASGAAGSRMCCRIFLCSGKSCTPRSRAPSSHGGACRGHDRQDRTDEAHPVHLASTADPSCAECGRHATLRGLCRRWAASTRPHFFRRTGVSTSQASRGSRPSLLSSAKSTTQLRRSRDRWWYARFGFTSSTWRQWQIFKRER